VVKRNFANKNYPWSSLRSLSTRLRFNHHFIPKKRRSGWNRANCTQLWTEHRNYPLIGFIRLSPILIVPSVFTISLAIGAYVRRSKIPEEDRFVVDFATFASFVGGCYMKISISRAMIYIIDLLQNNIPRKNKLLLFQSSLPIQQHFK
jgi:hypothetical protein